MFFFLLQAVKLESIRAGRTRYLVVVSRPRLNIPPQEMFQQEIAQNQIRQNTGIKSSNLGPVSSNNNQNQQNHQKLENHQEKCSCSDKSQNNNENNLINEQFSNFDNCDKNLSFGDNSLLCSSCDFCIDHDNISESDSLGCTSEREESCLLGIDCNEKTTVGLVLRLLADTSIRLDGDG